MSYKKRRRIKRGTGKRGCLCPDEDRYHPDCCREDNIWGQRVGQIYGDTTVVVEPSLGYGLLYNWYAATDVRGIAPDGFRVPSASDFTTLINSFDNAAQASIQLKGTRIISIDGHPGWGDTSNGDNLSDFNAYCYGVRNPDGAYSITTTVGPNILNFGRFHTTEDFGGDASQYLNLADRFNTQVQTTSFGIGACIRCVSDTEPETVLVQDNDGNNYSWVLIGSQYWLAQNLKTTTYNNGDAIPTGLDNDRWAAITDGAWAYPNGDDTLPI